jgi:hypothetical protein
MCETTGVVQGGRDFAVEEMKEGEAGLCNPNEEQCHVVQCFATSHDSGKNFIMFCRKHECNTFTADGLLNNISYHTQT